MNWHTTLTLFLFSFFSLNFYADKVFADKGFTNNHFTDKQLTAQKLQSTQGNDNLFKISEITADLVHPWGMAFLPDGSILVTERPGRLRIIKNGFLEPQAIKGLPAIKSAGQGGLLDVALHPDFQNNQLIYLSYVASNDKGMGTEVLRARLDNSRLLNPQIIFRLTNKTASTRHFGSRLVFDNEGYLYITIGDRGLRARAQDLNDHAGSVIRLYDDGLTPEDNPFVNQAGKLPQIFSFGHRNPQGMALHPQTGQVWIHEHGPQGGDEINIIHKANNYGWPVITYGVNYGLGTKIGEGTHKNGMIQPLYYWDPSIAPSGMSFYRGEQFPQWQGDLLVGSLKFQQLVHLKLDKNKVVSETRYLTGKLGRIRDVRVDSGGAIYLLTDARNGRLIRLDSNLSE